MGFSQNFQHEIFVAHFSVYMKKIIVIFVSRSLKTTAPVLKERFFFSF